MARASVPPWARLRGRAILYIDDDHALLDLIARTFDRAGGRCRTAESHEDGIRALAEDGDLGAVLVDFEMPDGEAADLIARLRTLRPDLVLVGTSGRDHRRDFARLGVDRYLAKPWRLEDLADAIGW